MIAENGGIIIEKKTSEPIYLFDIEKGEIKEAFEHLCKVIPVRKIKRSDLRRTEIALYRDFDPEFIRRILENFKVRVVDTKFAIHITDPNVNKGRALSVVAKMMGLTVEEFAAIGDSENDYETLQTAGLGIGVGEEKLRGAANFVTECDFAEGGVKALKYIIEEVEKGIKSTR
jgi:HAD superfamily hydrolase (TIGR01484 family)